jgi:glycosyltransferase involved in cell wall biosynthesis
MKLSICIPTFNRSKLLAEGLAMLLPQIKGRDDVYLYIFDNNSSDDTEYIVHELISNFKNVKYQKNETNIGYVGNQLRCIETPNTEYIAILCDDDIYLRNSIDIIMNTLKSHDHFSFVALNYFSFKESYDKPVNLSFAPQFDKLFERPYDIMNYPSVGHFSGFIFNRCLAQDCLSELKIQYGDNIFTYFEKHRGIITHLANIILSSCKLPSFFIGSHVLAARIPDVVDYDLLYHMNYDYLEYYSRLFLDGYINERDYKYRRSIVLSTLPKAIWIESETKSKIDYEVLKSKFDVLLFGNTYYRFFIRPMFKISQLFLFKKLFLLAYKVYKK